MLSLLGAYIEAQSERKAYAIKKIIERPIRAVPIFISLTPSSQKKRWHMLIEILTIIDCLLIKDYETEKRSSVRIETVIYCPHIIYSALAMEIFRE
jgi:hypothetical protein